MLLTYKIFPVLNIFGLSVIVLKVVDDCPGDLDFWYRHISKGGWTFSTADQGWPLADCTAEGLQVVTIKTVYIIYTKKKPPRITLCNCISTVIKLRSFIYNY